MPYTCPRMARRANSATAIPGPKPISSTRSVGCTSSNDTAQRLRCRLEPRCAKSKPTRRPTAPRGRPAWLTNPLITRCLSPEPVVITIASQRLQVALQSRCSRVLVVEIEPFEVLVGDDVLDDLRERIRRTRWPEP